MKIAPLTLANNRINNRQQHISYVNMNTPKDVFEKQNLTFNGLLPETCNYRGLFKEAVDNENISLLKKLIIEQNWAGFDPFKKCARCLIQTAQESDNSELQKLFSGKNLYNLVSKFSIRDLYILMYSDFEKTFNLLAAYHNYMPESSERRGLGNSLASECVSTPWHDGVKYLSQIPVTNYERSLLKNGKHEVKENIENAIRQRARTIKNRNGIDTPQQLLACMNDILMSSEVLTQNFNEGWTWQGKFVKDLFIEEIAKIPAGGENKEIMSKIIEKLSTMQKLPDNNIVRRAALIAAKNGNAELLQFFDSNGIHYANLRKEPIDSYPMIVREMLKNAKKNDPQVLELVNNPQLINTYFDIHADIDINSHDDYGNTLAMKAVRAKSLETLKVLAARDDFNWNAVNNDGASILMQLLYKSKDDMDFVFKVQVIDLLTKLPKGKLDLNYIKGSSNKSFDTKIINYLRKKDDEKNIEWAKNLYDTNGELTLDDIEKFLEYDRLEQIINMKFNVFGENIGHLLTDIFPNSSNLQELTRIGKVVEKLKNSGFDFNAKDELGRTPLDKAIEGENEAVADLLKRYL